MAKIRGTQFRFRQHERLGAEGAEQDAEFLSDCFYDVGDLKALRDCSDLHRIVVGRTGAGKTALLMKLRETEEHAVWLEPESLSLQYLSNSTILRHLSELGVNLDLFYRLLWKHIFAVELIRARFKITDEDSKKTFLQRTYDSFFGDKTKEKAIQYLVHWGESFWKDTEYRIREVTTKFENDIKFALKGKTVFFEGSGSTGRRLSTEEKAQIVQRAQDVVDHIQIRDLGKVITILGREFFSAPQPRYYIVIDRLDENWVDDAVRYRLIRALVETIKDFAPIKGAKIVIALRRDLIDRVVRLTRDAGFQEEKYEPLFLQLHWNETQLLELLDARISKLVRRQYTKQLVSHVDLLPKTVGRQEVEEWILSRTMYRPRDIIVLFNFCIDQAVHKPEITSAMMRRAEPEYSRRRFRSLGDEWAADYPELLSFAKLLKGYPRKFRVDELSDQDVEHKCLEVATQEGVGRGQLTELATGVVEDRMDCAEFRRELLTVFYWVGLVGFKLEPTQPSTWSFRRREAIRPGEIRNDSTVEVCPVFYRVLGIDER